MVKNYTQMDPLQEMVEIQLKRPRGPSFLLEQLERGQVAMRPGWALNTKCAGPRKTTVQATVLTYFLLKEEGRKTYKGFEYFSQGHDQESCGKHLFLLLLIFCTVLQIGQLTIKHFNILKHEVNRSGIFTARLIFLNIRRYNEETKFSVTPSFVLTQSSDSI